MTEFGPEPDESAALIVCSRSDDPNRREIPGSERRQCAECSAEICVASATLARPEAANPLSRFVCVECGSSKLDGVLIRPPTPAQIKELGDAGHDPDAWPLKSAWGKTVTKA